MFRKLTVIALLLIMSLSNFAQNDVPKQRNWTLNGYVKFMQTVSFQKIDENWITDNVLHNRLNFNWNINSNFTFNAQMRNRIFYGETVTNFPKYPQITNQDDGFFNLSFIVFEGKSVFMQSTFDRFYIDYNINNVQITIGRQRINWGQTFVWNPNDLFNSYNFFDFDYEEKPGSDALRIQYYPSYSSKLDVVVKINHHDTITAAALYRFNNWGYDIQFLGGYYNQTDFVVGAGFSGSLIKGGFRGEVSYFHPKDNFSDTTGTLVLSMGYDYTFNNALMLQFEGLYNGYGSKSSNFNLADFYFMQLSPKNLSLTELSFLGQVSFPITPLFNATFSAMYSPNDKSLYLGPSVIYSLKENLELSFYTQYFTSDTPIDQGGKGVFLYWRIKWSF